MIFGEPMENWRQRMPIGMHLKSDGFASSLFEPDGALTLRKYCADMGIEYADLGRPVALETFCAYGQAFQKQMVPMLDPRKVADVRRIGGQFRLALSDGASVLARKVIVASGISHFEYLPAELRPVPRGFLSHSALNRDLSRFKGRDVLVLGRGASSTDIAALLVDQGASTQIVSREPVEFHDPPSEKPRSLLQRLRRPNLGLGPSFRSALFTAFPHLFRYLPLARRQRIVRKHLGPAAVWYIRDKLEAHVPMHSGYAFRNAEVRGERIHVQFSGRDGGSKEFDVHHIIAGTGYQVDLRRLPFLSDSIRAEVRLEGNWPALSRHFESSVPGLYFVGLPSALTFGPLTRFAHGAGFTARRLSRHLARQSREYRGNRFSRALSMTSERPAVAIFDDYWATTLAFARSLGEKGVPLHFYGSGAGRWSRYRTRHSRCPPLEDADAFLRWLRSRVRSGEITHVAPTTDLIAFYVSVLRDEFSPAVRRAIAPLNEIENCLIKSRFRDLSAIEGQPPLVTLTPKDLAEALSAAASLGYPVMLKPKSHLVVGFAERGQLVRDARELERHFRPYDIVPGQQQLAELYPELRWPLLQRYLPSAHGGVYSVSGIKDADGGVVTARVSYKLAQWPLHTGVSTVQVGCDDPRVLRAGLQVLDQVLSRGIFEVELIADGANLHAIDLNPRAFGFVELDMARGSGLPWLWYCMTQERLTPLGERARNLVTAHHAFLPFLGVRMHTRSSVPLLGHWSDPLPKIIGHLRTMRHPRSLLRSRITAARALRDELAREQAAGVLQ